MSDRNEIFVSMSLVAVNRSWSGDDVTFYVLPVLWMTSCFLRKGKAWTTRIGRILKVTHQEAAPEAKFDVYDCFIESSNLRLCESQ